MAGVLRDAAADAEVCLRKSRHASGRVDGRAAVRVASQLVANPDHSFLRSQDQNTIRGKLPMRTPRDGSFGEMDRHVPADDNVKRAQPAEVTQQVELLSGDLKCRETSTRFRGHSAVWSHRRIWTQIQKPSARLDRICPTCPLLSGRGATRTRPKSLDLCGKTIHCLYLHESHTSRFRRKMDDKQ